MKDRSKNKDILKPIEQLNLYGYENYFISFLELLNKKKLPNTLLLSGPKGIGKATFSYHFINYILSNAEENKYSLDNFKINHENYSYNLICRNSHPNFFLLDNFALEENIKISHIRELSRYLSKSTYLQNIKIVLIDNIENLNTSSSNALLKALEEPSKNTYFFIIHNSSSFIPKTIKSRCLEFKFFLTHSQKNKIFYELNDSYNFDTKLIDFENFLYKESHGNILHYLSILSESGLDVSSPPSDITSFLIENYKGKKDTNSLYFLSLYVEDFYNNLFLKNKKNLTNSFYNRSKILSLIQALKNFNLDKKSLLISINEILAHEGK